MRRALVHDRPKRFNPRLPGGRRPGNLPARRVPCAFQSTPSGGKATGFPTNTARAGQFQSTPSGGKATKRRGRREREPNVSIHAFRGEGDVRSTSNTASPSRFQSTPSGGKATRVLSRSEKTPATFQSTPSGGKATNVHRTRVRRRREFQSTPSGGKATSFWSSATMCRPVSIHAFRGEGDLIRDAATLLNRVSIHAFRGEGDQASERPGRAGSSFNPRLPGGRRPRLKSDD